MLKLLTQCFPWAHPSAAVSLSSSDVDCVFCHVTHERGFNIVYEDDKYIMFKDHKPAAEHHLLVIPRKHITSVKNLRKKDADMVKAMEHIGRSYLDELGIPPHLQRLGFHVPPITSVNHLHLHVFGLPWKSTVVQSKYPVKHGGGGYIKGWSWFAEVEQTIQILEKGGGVRLGPC
ncbi:HIT-like protein [Amylostereum chailletii]|nr:HIT-like protein [Amylostereum chailletii]